MVELNNSINKVAELIVDLDECMKQKDVNSACEITSDLFEMMSTAKRAVSAYQNDPNNPFYTHAMKTEPYKMVELIVTHGVGWAIKNFSSQDFQSKVQSTREWIDKQLARKSKLDIAKR